MTDVAAMMLQLERWVGVGLLSRVYRVGDVEYAHYTKIPDGVLPSQVRIVFEVARSASPREAGEDTNG